MLKFLQTFKKCSHFTCSHGLNTIYAQHKPTTKSRT